MAIRGRRAVDRSGWMRPGGSLPTTAPELTDHEQEQYAWIRGAMASLTMGGKSDIEIVALTAKLMARMKSLTARLDALPDPCVTNGQGNLAMHPMYAEVGRIEVRVAGLLSLLYLTPKARAGARIPAETQGEAIAGEQPTAAILRLLEG